MKPSTALVEARHVEYVHALLAGVVGLASMSRLAELELLLCVLVSAALIWVPSVLEICNFEPAQLAIEKEIQKSANFAIGYAMRPFI